RDGSNVLRHGLGKNELGVSQRHKGTKCEDAEGLFTYLFLVCLEPIARCGLPKESPYEGNPESSCLGFVP
ncbi:hypothetical protein, partial [Lentimonas sp. CC8]